MTQIPETPSMLRITPIARLATGAKWRVEAMRSLREPMLLWFIQGQGRITIAGTMHGFEITQRVQGTAVFFGRDSGLQLPRTPLHFRLRETAPQKEIISILEGIQRELDSGRAGALRAAQHHLGLLSVWLDRQVADMDPLKPDHTPAAQKLAARYASLLERDFRSNTGVAEYAEALGVTPTHLTRACKASCGRTALALLQDRRLFEARRLLSETRMAVKDVSFSLGFASAGYFTRAFQQHTGQTPSSFRRVKTTGPVVPLR
jgi:AraC family transcriptional activator of pobA